MREMNISGTTKEWLSLGTIFASTQRPIFCTKVVNPYPYTYSAEKIEIKLTNETQMQFSHTPNRDIVLTGRYETFIKLAELIDSFATVYHKGEHFHFDYITNYDLVTKDSGLIVFEMT